MEDKQIQHLIDATRKDEYKTQFENIFVQHPLNIDKKKPLVITFFGPSTVGKDTLIEPLHNLPFVSFVTTATSRAQRADEPDTDYIWMPPRKENESVESYTKKMVKKFQLIEHDSHYGELYGLPLQSIKTSAKKGIAIVRTNYAGAEAIKKVLEKDYNVVAIAIQPVHWSEIKARILKMRNTPLWRISEAVRSLHAAVKIADYVIFNPFNHGELANTQKVLVAFVTQLYSQLK